MQTAEQKAGLAALDKKSRLKTLMGILIIFAVSFGLQHALKLPAIEAQGLLVFIKVAFAFAFSARLRTCGKHWGYSILVFLPFGFWVLFIWVLILKPRRLTTR